MTSSYRAYIDESGDEGFVFLPGELGSSRWLVVSALVLRTAKDHQVVEVARQVREKLGKPSKKPLHFRELKHEQRLPYARMIGQMSARTVSVLVHKPSIQAPEVFQQQAYSLYRYATRLLLERVSWLCRDNHKTDEGDGRVELIFSNRSAMSYDALRIYLERLRDDPREAAEVRVDWNVIDPKLVRAIHHDQLAGLQLADAVATSVYKAVNASQYGETEPRYLELIAPTIYRHEGNVNGYGLKFWGGDTSLQQSVVKLVKSPSK